MATGYRATRTELLWLPLPGPKPPALTDERTRMVADLLAVFIEISLEISFLRSPRRKLSTQQSIRRAR